MTRPDIGDDAPDFTATTDSGAVFRLSAQRGHPVVLMFYAQADTEGCNIENLEYSALMPRFRELGAAVVAISPDSLADQCRFRDKFQLAVPQVADSDRRIIESYGVWGPKKLYGREYVGLIRTSFLIDPQGRVAHHWHVTRIKGHAARVVAEIEVREANGWA
jgi:peroxiredoxin Q/BCP